MTSVRSMNIDATVLPDASLVTRYTAGVGNLTQSFR